jgi:hypothetical protein
MRNVVVALTLIWAVGGAKAQASIKAVDGDPGPARAIVGREAVSLVNGDLEAKWALANGRFGAVAFRNDLDRSVLRLNGSAFTLVLRDGTVVPSTALDIVGVPSVQSLVAARDASRMSERLAGRQVGLTLADPRGRFKVAWRGLLRDGSNYIRQEVSITAGSEELPLQEVRLVQAAAPGAVVVGKVPGSPIVAGDTFLGVENPLARSEVAGSDAICAMRRALPLSAGQTVTYTSVIGVAPKGQMRRAFLNYLERERAHPYRTFLHYNSWYDLGYGSPFAEPEAAAAVAAIGEELTVKRHVKLDSFLFDDGWDDPTTLWGFNKGFPEGFTPIRDLAAKFGAAPGVWMSPWGGYGEAHDKRIANGKSQGFEVVNGGFALSGPIYYKRFHDTCVRMIQKYGVNQFKFDGTGNVSQVIPGSAFGSDFEAMIALITDLRNYKADLFVNLTTGTWPSPFWTRYADSIWRGGGDHDFAGVGSNRQKWITYRDGDTYRGVVRRGPLYPLNSLMLHGLLYGRFADGVETDPKNELADEIQTYFGSGTQLQELYITPSLLSAQNWDDLAEAANWSRRNASVLVDTHWVGGDPLKLEAYGWASWSPRKSILVLRNPSDKPQTILIEIGKVLEIPEGFPSIYEGRSPWKADRRQPTRRFMVGRPEEIQLQPFEVATWELTGK